MPPSFSSLSSLFLDCLHHLTFSCLSSSFLFYLSSLCPGFRFNPSCLDSHSFPSYLSSSCLSCPSPDCHQNLLSSFCLFSSSSFLDCLTHRLIKPSPSFSLFLSYPSSFSFSSCPSMALHSHRDQHLPRFYQTSMPLELVYLRFSKIFDWESRSPC